MQVRRVRLVHAGGSGGDSILTSARPKSNDNPEREGKTRNMTSRIIVAIVAVFAIVAGFAGCGGDSPVGPTTRTNDPTTPTTDPLPPVAPPQTNAPASIANTTITLAFRSGTGRCLSGTLDPDLSFTESVSYSFGPNGRIASIDGESIDELIEEARQEGLVARYSTSYSRLNANRARLTLRVDGSGSLNGSSEGTIDLTFDGSSRGQFTWTAQFRGDLAEGESCTRISSSGTFEIRRN